MVDSQHGASTSTRGLSTCKYLRSQLTCAPSLEVLLGSNNGSELRSEPARRWCPDVMNWGLGSMVEIHLRVKIHGARLLPMSQ